MLRYGSVCSGIEAATVAWHPLGWRPAFFAQFDPEHDYARGPDYPSAVLAHHYPEVPNLGDFTIIPPDAGPIDLLVGGTPCQSFSGAGLRAGLDDERGNLALEFCRLARRLGPRWVVWENVPGVLSLDGGLPFASILGGLADCGYGLAYRVLDAQFVRVDGFGRAVPQRRRRVFVVGYLCDWRRAAAVLFERASLSGNPAPRREAGQGVAHSVTARAGNGSRPAGGNGNLAAFKAAQHKGNRGQCAAQAFDLRGREDGSQLEGPHDTANIRAARGGSSRSYIAFDETQITSGENRCNPQPGDACHPLARGARPPTLAFHARQDPDTGSVTHPLDTDGGSIGVMHNWSVRRLMPVECERLQGFPDGYTAIPYRGKPAADGQRYKALGNSMAINVMRWIGRRIEMVEEIGADPALADRIAADRDREVDA